MGRGRFADVQFIESTQLISLRQPTGQKKVPEIISQTVVPAKSLRFFKFCVMLLLKTSDSCPSSN